MTAFAEYLAAREAESARIPAARRRALEELAAAMAESLRRSGRAELVFVCTHNSRRSQFAQVWAMVAAWRHGLRSVLAASGGTEITACEPRAVAALERAGLVVTRHGAPPNPVHAIAVPGSAAGTQCWSKRFDDPQNPSQAFLAVMVCSAADAACPTVRGAGRRLTLPYEDPKAADGTPGETAAYDRCCAEIARELLYAFRCAARAAPFTAP